MNYLLILFYRRIISLADLKLQYYSIDTQAGREINKKSIGISIANELRCGGVRDHT